MALKGNMKREQWEALIVESSYWHRVREVDEDGRYVNFDVEDLRLLDDGLQTEFRRLGGFELSVRDADRLDHPLARFFRLMYTDEFKEFRTEVFRDVYGVSSMSIGVQEMLLDQIFRYFVFVKDSPLEARRFGQLVCSIAVFRNTYDESNNKFVENGIAKSRRNLFKSQSKLLSRGLSSFEEKEYVSLDEIGIPADYERNIAEFVRDTESGKNMDIEVLDVDMFGNFYTEDLSIYTPLPANTAAYSPTRKSVLHVMQVIGRYVSSEIESVDIIYTGTLSGNALQMIREVLPPNFKVFPTLDKINPNKYTIVFLDDEADKESSGTVGDDNMYMQQLSIVKGLQNTFRTKLGNLLAVSLTFRVPYVLSGPGRFEFISGTILNTPWKNPQDERQRLVWTPELSTEVIEYRSKKIVSSRKMLDYVVRSLIVVPTKNVMDVESPGLVDGEFDSELERLIVKRFYDNFSFGLKSWMEVATEDIMCFPRFIGSEPMVGKLKLLNSVYQFVIDYHTSIPTNPLIQYVSKCARSGIFCTSQLSASPLKEALSKVFGDGVEIYEMYKVVSKDRSNVILQIREKNIFPRVRSKTVSFEIAKSVSPNYKDLVSFEPYAGKDGHNFVYDLMGSGEGRSVVLVQLGDSLGNLMYETLENLAYMKVRVKEVVYESSFSLSEIWKNISSESIPLQRLKNAFSLKETLEKLRSPFIIMRGHSYPEDIFQAVINSLVKMDSYLGYLNVENTMIVAQPPRRLIFPGKILSDILSSSYSKEIRTTATSIMIIGSEHEMDLSFLTNTTLKRVFHVVESGAGARRISHMTKPYRKMTHRIFVQENLTTNFVAPLEDVTLQTIIVNYSVFSRMASSKENMNRFLQEVGKIMSPHSTLIVLDLESIWQHMDRYGRKVDGAGTMFDSPLISGMVTDSSFQTPHGSGKRFSKETLESVLSNNGYKLDVFHQTDFNGAVDEPYTMSSENPADRLSPYSLARMVETLVIMKEYMPQSQYLVQEEPYSAYEGQAVDIGSKVRAYNNFVKRSLIEGVKDHSRVLDLACGHGQDIPKWFVHDTMEVYVGMDASFQAIDEADNRIRTRRGFKPRILKMITADVFGSHNWSFEAEDFLRPKTLFTSISCQLAIHYAFRDEKTIKRFMYNVSRLLEMGGEFIVTTIDNEVLKRVLERVDSQGDLVHARGQHYHIKMNSEMYSALMNNPVVVPGVSYEFTQFPSDTHSRTTTEYVVDSNYFKQLASDMGLRLLERRNFLNVDSTESIDFDAERSKLEKQDREVAAFYTTYHFIKVNGVAESMAEIQPVASFTDSEKAYKQAMEILSMGTSEKLSLFKRGLFLGPETIFPVPYIEQGYEKVDVITDDISQVKPLYQQLKSMGRLSDKEMVHLLKISGSQNESYDLVYLSPSLVHDVERYVGRMSDEGVMYATFVSRETLENVLQGDSEFANSVFEIFVDKLAGKYSINSPLNENSHHIVDMDALRERLIRMGLSFSKVDTNSWQQDSKLSPAQKQFLSIFGMFRITKSTPLEITPAQPQIAQPEPEEPAQQSSVDKFVLLPGLVQKKAPGKGRDESLASPGSLYKDLAKDQRWRFKLSDDWESAEFPVRMPSGEIFSSVTNAMIYYKCRFADEENKEYLGINLASGLPVPTDMKPFTKAIRGKKGQQWKEQELQIMRSVYEAKFVNTPNAVDEPDNLTPLRALLLTRNAHLYSNSKTRNEMLENIRRVLQGIVGI
jgi:SAM-dependent methyltransferase